jgi:hypothetical protein
MRAMWSSFSWWTVGAGFRLASVEESGNRTSSSRSSFPDGRTLQTDISHDRSSTISAGLFGMILREQLEVSRTEFWEAIRTGEPVDRPVPTDDE